MQPRRQAPDWGAEGAKCVHFPSTRTYDPWFVSEHEADAVALCNGTEDGIVCPIRDACIIYACVNNESYGVWGGRTEEERILMRRAARKKYRARPDLAPISEWTWPHLESN